MTLFERIAWVIGWILLGVFLYGVYEFVAYGLKHGYIP